MSRSRQFNDYLVHSLTHPLTVSISLSVSLSLSLTHFRCSAAFCFCSQGAIGWCGLERESCLRCFLLWDWLGCCVLGAFLSSSSSWAVSFLCLPSILPLAAFGSAHFCSSLRTVSKATSFRRSRFSFFFPLLFPFFFSVCFSRNEIFCRGTG